MDDGTFMINCDTVSMCFGILTVSKIPGVPGLLLLLLFPGLFNLLLDLLFAASFSFSFWRCSSFLSTFSTMSLEVEDPDGG